MCIKFESPKICVAGNQCDNSGFNFHNAEHKELPVIKISSDDEGREDCPKLKTKGTQASLGTTVIAVTILLIHSISFSRVTVMYLFLSCALCFSCNEADLATQRERQLTTARANQTTGLTNGRATNWAPEVEFSRFRALSRRQMTFAFCC